MADKYLNTTGLTYLWGRIKSIFATKTENTAVSDRVTTLENVGAQANVIESVKRNGTALTPDASKAVDISVPTAVSELINDSNYQTGTQVDTTAEGKVTIKKITVNGDEVTPDAQKTVALTKPTKTSDLTNDGDGTSAFATENYVTTNGGKIDKIQVNGVDQTIGANKTVNITMPTKVSDLTNDSDYQSGTQVDTTAEGKVTIKKIKVNNVDQAIDSTDKSVNITMPTKVSDLSNDGDGTSGSKFATEAYVDTNGGKIDKIKVNGTEQQIVAADKSVNITMPTKVSDLTNDGDGTSGSSFPTKAEMNAAISASVASAYKFKGSVATYADLPSTGVVAGDVYNVESNGMNYARTEAGGWDALGQLVDTSLLWAKSELTAITTAEIDAIIDAAA